jgi:hypothetical protein
VTARTNRASMGEANGRSRHAYFTDDEVRKAGNATLKSFSLHLTLGPVIVAALFGADQAIMSGSIDGLGGAMQAGAILGLLSGTAIGVFSSPAILQRQFRKIHAENEKNEMTEVRKEGSSISCYASVKMKSNEALKVAEQLNEISSGDYKLLEAKCRYFSSEKIEETYFLTMMRSNGTISEMALTPDQYEKTLDSINRSSVPLISVEHDGDLKISRVTVKGHLDSRPLGLPALSVHRRVKDSTQEAKCSYESLVGEYFNPEARHHATCNLSGDQDDLASKYRGEDIPVHPSQVYYSPKKESLENATGMPDDLWYLVAGADYVRIEEDSMTDTLIIGSGCKEIKVPDFGCVEGDDDLIRSAGIDVRGHLTSEPYHP